VLWKSLEMSQQRVGLGNVPRIILEELAHMQHDVILTDDDTRRGSGSVALPSPTTPSSRCRSPRYRAAKRLRPDDLELPLALTA
jgi:hypothetical protein